MAEKFLIKVASFLPEIVGKTLFLCAKGYPDVPCKLQSDGTIVSLENVVKPYRKAIDLLHAVLGPGAKGVAVNDIYLAPFRKQSVGNLLRKRLKGSSDCAPVFSGRFERCGGFSFHSKAVTAAIRSANGPFSGLKVNLDGCVFRSVACFGRTSNHRDALCASCKRVHGKVMRILRSSKKKRLCQGLPKIPYQDVISERRWETDRRRFSLVEADETRIRSVKCDGMIAGNGQSRKCAQCRKLWSSLRTLRSRIKRKKGVEEMRIMHSPTKYLTSVDCKRKQEIATKRLRTAMKRLRQAETKCERARGDVQKYQPAFPENRKALLALKDYMDKETVKYKSPVCYWQLDNGTICDIRCETPYLLLQHLSDAHIRPQSEENKCKAPDERSYVCEWEYCRWITDFPSRKRLYSHVRRHVGSRRAAGKLQILREQCINANRSATGRRYSAATKHFAVEKYQSRRQWRKLSEFSPLPVPSGNTVRAAKNAGIVEQGVDRTILETMQKAAEGKPYLNHGMLVFDEVYIRPEVTFHSSSKTVFGYADDRPGELAKTILVFQYVAIFSKRRFRANVAWFGCEALNQDSLLRWFFCVGEALMSYGFVLHGLVCDGAAANRGLQEYLLRAFRDDKTKEDNGVLNPFSTEVPRFFVLSDPSHCMKKFRSSWADPKRALVRGGKPIKWEHVKNVYYWQQQHLLEGYRIDRPLTQLHVNLKTFEKMIVKTAVDVVSEPIERVMETMNGTEGTRAFMRMLRDFWLAVNSKRTYYSLQSTESLRLTMSTCGQELAKWRAETQGQPSRFVTVPCFNDAMALCRGMPGLIEQVFNTHITGVKNQFTPKLCTQDFLERDFGSLRQRSGGAGNPTIQSAAYVLRTMAMNRLHRAISNANP